MLKHQLDSINQVGLSKNKSGLPIFRELGKKTDTEERGERGRMNG